MKPLLICVHVFYLNMWPQLQTAISHMVHFPHELFITTSHEDESFKQKVRNTFPQAKIIKVANIGYDGDSTERGQNRSYAKSCWAQYLMKNVLNKGKMFKVRLDNELANC